MNDAGWDFVRSGIFGYLAANVWLCRHFWTGGTDKLGELVKLGGFAGFGYFVGSVFG